MEMGGKTVTTIVSMIRTSTQADSDNDGQGDVSISPSLRSSIGRWLIDSLMYLATD